jgi:hypothetical protein
MTSKKVAPPSAKRRALEELSAIDEAVGILLGFLAAHAGCHLAAGEYDILVFLAVSGLALLLSAPPLVTQS